MFARTLLGTPNIRSKILSQRTLLSSCNSYANQKMGITSMTSTKATPAAAEAVSIPTDTVKTDIEVRPPLPPFTRESAIQKIRAAEDAWNSRDADRVKMAYTKDTVWRNRSTFVTGRDDVREFLSGKWDREKEYRLIKELWAYTDNRIAVRFCYEYHDDAGQWFRAYGNENWEFNEHGLMQHRHASINDVPIGEMDRKFHWPSDVNNNRRPDDHPGLSDLGL